MSRSTLDDYEDAPREEYLIQLNDEATLQLVRDFMASDSAVPKMTASEGIAIAVYLVRRLRNDFGGENPDTVMSDYKYLSFMSSRRLDERRLNDTGTGAVDTLYDIVKEKFHDRIVALANAHGALGDDGRVKPVFWVPLVMNLAIRVLVSSATWNAYKPMNFYFGTSAHALFVLKHPTWHGWQRDPEKFGDAIFRYVNERNPRIYSEESGSDTSGAGPNFWAS